MADDLFAPARGLIDPKALWPHQERTLAQLRQALLAGFRRVVIQLPTGAGKTKLASEIVHGALRKGNSVSFTVPYLSLIDQTIEAFESEGIDSIGVLQGIHERRNRSMPVQVCSVQTLARRAFPSVKVVIVDEAHIRSRAITTWMRECPDVIFIGLSATPWARGMGRAWEHLIIGATLPELVAAGRLSPIKVYAPSHPDLSGVAVKNGEYVDRDSSALMSGTTLVEESVSAWKRLGPGRRTLCYAVDRAHATRLHEEFSASGIEAAYIDAYTTADERDTIKRRFHADDVKIVISIGCLVAGVDWDVRCISWCAPTKSEIKLVQCWGRAMRLGHGKTHAVILDHAGTVLALGLPEDIRHDKLDDGKISAAQREASGPPKARLPTECRQCGAIKAPGVYQCQECGHKPQKQSSIVVEDGELVQLGMKSPAKEKYNTAEKIIIYGMFKHFAHQHKYSDGWCAHKFREKTGVWPNNYKNAPMREPSIEILNWLRSRQIAWSKSKQRRTG